MSTRTDATYDDATTNPRTDPTTDDFSTDATPASDAPAADSDTTPGSDALAPNSGTSWTDQCKRQFSTTSTTRMRNLNDDENQAMHEGM